MKINKLLIVYAVLGLIVMACDDDENEQDSLTPRVDFTFSPESPAAGEPISFTAEAQDPSSEIVSWTWAFHDEDSTTSNEMAPTFTYKSGGTYEVTLDVTDASGNAFRIAHEVVVNFAAQVVWEFTNNTTVKTYNEGSNAPVIGADGTVYYIEGNADELSKVVAVTDGGESASLKWSTALIDDIDNAAAIGPDGNIYITSWGSGNGHVYRLDGQTGSIAWTMDTNAGVSNNTTAIDSEGNIYHGSRSGANSGIFSWAPDGTKRWDIIDIGAFYAAPVISADETTVYYLNTDTGKIWAVNTADGTTKWTEPVGAESGGYGSSLSIDADGTIYFTTNDYVAAVVDNGTTGALKWATEVDGPANSGVVIGPSGDLYTGSAEGLLSLNPADGSINWTYEAEITESVPAVDANGNVYVGTMDGTLLIVNEAGDLQTEIPLTTTNDPLATNVINSPTIAADGTVYVEGLADSVIKLFKIAIDNSSGPADSPWPMKGQNVKNTGKAQ